VEELTPEPTPEETYEEDAPFEARLRAWLLDQEEYLIILSLSRSERRSGLHRLANIILTFPEAPPKPGANRKENRAQMNQLKKRLSHKLDDAQQKKSRQQRRIDSHIKRARRLTEKRIAFLIEREQSQRTAQELLSEAESAPTVPFQADLLDDEARARIMQAQDDGYDVGGEG
jgi:hypothetical protein